MDHNGSMFLGIFVVVYKQLRITPTLLLQPQFRWKVHGDSWTHVQGICKGYLWMFMGMT
jgi:hypothetical protein